MMPKIRRLLFASLLVVNGSGDAETGTAQDDGIVKLPADVPDYTGVTAGNFFEKAPAGGDNPFGDYPLPKIDPGKALVVDATGVGGTPADGNPGSVDKPFQTLGRALREARPGAIILLRKGSYPIHRLALDGATGQKGTRDQPIWVGSGCYCGHTGIVLEGFARYGLHDVADRILERIQWWADDLPYVPQEARADCRSADTGRPNLVAAGAVCRALLTRRTLE